MARRGWRRRIEPVDVSWQASTRLVEVVDTFRA